MHVEFDVPGNLSTISKKMKEGEGLRTDSKTLVLPTDENRRYDISADEQSQEQIVQVFMVHYIKDAEPNQTDCPNQSKD